jgi:DNA invertase Pin-like site-specific DNA recombinase
MAVSQLKEIGSILYGRVSTDEQVKEGHSIETQGEDLAAFAQLKRHSRTLHLSDEGASARTTNRPKLQFALSLLAAGEYDVLVVTHLDRLSRSLRDVIDIIEQSKREGWSIVFLDIDGQQVDTGSAFGMFMIHVLAAVAQLKSDDTSERTKIGLAKAKANGKVLGPQERVDKFTIKLILQLWRKGNNLSEIARELDARGVATPRHKPQWCHETIRGVLMRELGPRYVPLYTRS